MSVETLRQTCAKSGATVETLRKQVSEMKRELNGGAEKKTSSEITQLQTDIGRHKRQLTEKVSSIIQGKVIRFTHLPICMSCISGRYNYKS